MGIDGSGGVDECMETGVSGKLVLVEWSLRFPRDGALPRTENGELGLGVDVGCDSCLPLFFSACVPAAIKGSNNVAEFLIEDRFVFDLLRVDFVSGFGDPIELGCNETEVLVDVFGVVDVLSFGVDDVSERADEKI